MGKRLSKIYTRTGDGGETGLGDGTRVAKDDLRIEAIGDVDELNSFIGLLVEELNEGDTTLAPIARFLRKCQHRAFDVGGELSIPGFRIIDARHVTEIEDQLDELNQHLDPLENFILPGGSRLVATIHLARSVCRRAERSVVKLSERDEINDNGLKFLNRLSDYLFVAARYTALKTNVPEVLWQKDQTESDRTN